MTVAAQYRTVVECEELRERCFGTRSRTIWKATGILASLIGLCVLGAVGWAFVKQATDSTQDERLRGIEAASGKFEQDTKESLRRIEDKMDRILAEMRQIER